MENIKPLPYLQSRVLLEVFDNIYTSDLDTYFILVDVDELFMFLLGGDIDKAQVLELLEESCKLDVNSYVNLIDFCTLLEVIIRKAEELEYYEICQNANTTLKELQTLLNKVDEYYTQYSGDLSECDN